MAQRTKLAADAATEAAKTSAKEAAIAARRVRQTLAKTTKVSENQLIDVKTALDTNTKTSVGLANSTAVETEKLKKAVDETALSTSSKLESLTKVADALTLW